MQEYEVNTIINNLQYLDKNEWERHRHSLYSQIQMNSKTQISPKDIMKFAWDEETHANSISEADIERLKQKSKQIYNSIFKNG